MLEKTSMASVVSKLLIFKELPLRTWPFACPQGVEKERGKRAKNAKIRRRGGRPSPQAEVKNPARLGA
jgi:hypothetical protein